MPNTTPAAETYSFTTVPLASVVELTEYDGAEEAAAVCEVEAPPGTTAARDTAPLAVAPFGVAIGAPPSTAWAGAAANAATRLASTGRTNRDMTRGVAARWPLRE